ncbi:hypothetical protein ABK046_48865, partial [Streptomyces caeruleatus]
MRQVLKLMFPYIKPFWKEALAAVLLALPMAGLKAYEAFIVKDIFDKGFSAHATFQDAAYLAGLLV